MSGNISKADSPVVFKSIKWFFASVGSEKVTSKFT